MFRQSPRRNGRNKGLKIKHALLISVLLGVSIWLLYQFHHSNDKKTILVEINVNEKPRNDSSKDMFKLGRKDLRPKVMETTIKDSKEAVEHHVGEQGNGNEDEKLARDHESEEHEETGDNKYGDGREDSEDNEDGIGKITKTEHKQTEKEHDVKEHDESGFISDNIQTGHEGEQKEDGGSKKEATKGGNKGNEMENKKESLITRDKESKNKDQGKQKEVKELHKQNEEIKVKVNENKSNKQKKAVVMDKIERKDKSKKENGNKMSSKPEEPLSPSTDHHQRVAEEVENEIGKDDTSNSNVPSVDESQLGSSQSHNDAGTNAATNSEKERQGDENLNNEIETLTVSKKQTVQQINTTPVSYLTPSVDHDTAVSVNGNLTDSSKSNRNEKNDEGGIDSGAQDMEQVPNENKDDASVLEDEKDAVTDLGTLPDNGTGGHITSEDSDTE
ncbi:hypothetical protein CTI12_AA090750 [Artemisia annua]|uniref:Uncharacterized protein n=1 Tax=Artemisia annua TaxID=35608 RepID=A0A2U1PRQ8_ARTAN|nr:hypothetical protein CTI12_AA090750 [Artemisia annua]